MHTFILTIITSILLPLLATAQAPRWRPQHWPPSVEQAYYWGDVLNVTKCYCESGDGVGNPGSYYQFDYRNFHNKQVYTLSWTCDNSNTTTGWGQNGVRRVSFPLPECWNGHDSWRKLKAASCVRSYNADLFCFELGNKDDPHDHYYFNGEKRGLPKIGVIEYSPDMCLELCRDKVRGKNVASDSEGGWTKSVPSTANPLITIKSSFQSYTNLDDMTAN